METESESGKPEVRRPVVRTDFYLEDSGDVLNKALGLRRAGGSERPSVTELVTDGICRPQVHLHGAQDC